jgi:hypothetical protein
MSKNHVGWMLAAAAALLAGCDDDTAPVRCDTDGFAVRCDVIADKVTVEDIIFNRGNCTSAAQTIKEANTYTAAHTGAVQSRQREAS